MGNHQRHAFVLLQHRIQRALYLKEAAETQRKVGVEVVNSGKGSGQGSGQGTSFSLTESRAEVASSSSRIGGARIIARAMAMRCFCLRTTRKPTGAVFSHGGRGSTQRQHAVSWPRRQWKHTKARALKGTQRCWMSFYPPESLMPFSPTSVASAFGNWKEAGGRCSSKGRGAEWRGRGQNCRTHGRSAGLLPP